MVNSLIEANENINVPARTQVPIISYILLFFATVFGAYGVSQILNIFSLFSSTIINYIVVTFKIKDQFSMLIVGLIFLILSLIILRTSNKFIEWANQLKQRFKITNNFESFKFYNLKVVPTEHIVNHMIKERGCKFYEDTDNDGFGIFCPYIPITASFIDKIKVRNKTFSLGTTIMVLIFINLIIILPLFLIRDTYIDINIASWIWYILLILILLILYDSNILPMWSLVIVYMLHTILGYIIAPEALNIITIAIPGFFIFFGITIIIYIFKSEYCEKESNWWCDRL